MDFKSDENVCIWNPMFVNILVKYGRIYINLFGKFVLLFILKLKIFLKEITKCKIRFVR